ncbi:uncharacterized protein LOC132203120 [Neocloeon triangulifer]|uniref:uncharacterized protein LOC132203120 n=1 Tax=Neocloeon triangulifer TaxID=2078957 RepID=UPI00286F9DEC|nr:uncharacterized protein LOC132203120 [Neocloeon triangulifer]
MEPSKSNKVSAMIPGLTNTPQGSLESLSEYTDAHEDTPSAPTEFLAEFLSAIMTKDYETALKYCKLILQYEPYNATAKELYPLIIEKIQLNCNNDESGEDSSGEPCSDGTTASYSSLEDEEVLEYDNSSFYNNGNGSSSSHGEVSSFLDSPSEEMSHKMQLLADHANGNNVLVAPPTSSEESSPTEPAGHSLLETMSKIKL